MVQTRSASGMTPARALPTTPTPRPRARSAGGGATGFAHVPAALTLVWLAVSLPLVAWDTGYVLLRPATMPGGALHWPLWAPYKLYGEVDGIYGAKAWAARNGFTAAQSALNVVETAMYAAYVWLWYSAPAPTGRAASRAGARKGLGGRTGATALLVGFAAAVMTLSKTVLYCGFPGFPSPVVG
jgi:hypothetical protein